MYVFDTVDVGFSGGKCSMCLTDGEIEDVGRKFSLVFIPFLFSSSLSFPQLYSNDDYV